MRKFAAVLALVLFAACEKKEEAAPMAMAPTLADFAGTWQVTTILATTNDTVHSVLTGTAEATGWTTTLPGRPSNALTVSIVGDSLIAQSAEYESILRKGVQVSTRTAVVKVGSGLVGQTTATYRMASGTEMAQGNVTATKTP